MNSLWLVTSSLAAFAAAYRFYGALPAATVTMFASGRRAPAQQWKEEL